jgi:hypothetical protein
VLRQQHELQRLRLVHHPELRRAVFLVLRPRSNDP